VGSNMRLARSLELSKVSVQPHSSSSLKYAFEIFGAEKSFIAIAPSAGNQQEWIESIKQTRAALLASNSALQDTAVTDIAPIWAADKDADKCFICSGVSRNKFHNTQLHELLPLPPLHPLINKYHYRFCDYFSSRLLGSTGDITAESVAE
jgi:hypothetical protein